MMRVYDMIVC